MIHHEIIHKMLYHEKEDLKSIKGVVLDDNRINFLLDLRIQGLSYQMMPETEYQSFWQSLYQNLDFPNNLLYSGSVYFDYIPTMLHREIFSPFGVSLTKAAEILFKSDDDDKQSSLVNTFGFDAKADGNYLPGDKVDSYSDYIRDKIKSGIDKSMAERRKEDRISGNMSQSEHKHGHSYSKSHFLKSIKKVKSIYNANRFMKKQIELSMIDVNFLNAKKLIKKLFPSKEDISVIPNFNDNRAAVLYSLGYWPIFFKTKYPDKRSGECHVFIDISGSQSHVIDFVVELFSHLVEYLNSDIKFFSDKISVINKKELKNENLKINTTGGTDFNCIVDYAVKNNIKKCLVITDGFSSIDDERVAKSISKNINYIVGYTEETHGDGFNSLLKSKFDIPKKNKED